jgi:hypothetical protein
MKTTETKCDGCGSQLDDAGGMPTFGLTLSTFKLPSSGGISYDIAMSPELDRNYHFCGLNCLDSWRDVTSRVMRKDEVTAPQRQQIPPTNETTS